MKIFNGESRADIQTHLSDEHVEELEEIADERGVSRARLLRQLVYAGWKADQQFQFNKPTEEHSTNPVGTDPYEEIFVEHLPESEEEAVDIDELQDRIVSAVESSVMRLFRDSERIEMNSEGGVFKK